ncbi:MAG: porin, partial [Nitratireductor sp.]
RAADAVVIAEPEPVEYVRVCDAYGAGFFYIPGTETCLRISGYVWYQVGTGSDASPLKITPETDYVLNAKTGLIDPPKGATIGGTDTPGAFGRNDDGDEGWYKLTRARVNIDARQETEWGSLRSRIRLQSTWGTPEDGPLSVDQAYIELGGLMMGYSESFWADSKNGGPSNYGSHSWHGMYYGYQQRHLIGYRFDGGNGFFGAISLEDDTLSGRGYMPDVVAKIGISQGWGAVWAKVAYDESRGGRNVAGLPAFAGYAVPSATADGWAVQLGAQINVPNMPGSSLRILGFYADSDNSYGPGSALGVQPEWSILASYNHQFSSTLGVSVAAQYFADLYFPGSSASTGIDAWGAEISLVWMPVSQFEVRTELHYDDIGTVPAFGGSPAFDPDGTVSGYLRFTRYF